MFGALAVSLPVTYCPQVMQFMTQHSGWGEKEMGREKWASLAASCTAGEARYSLLLSLPASTSPTPCPRKFQAEKGSLDTELCCLGGGVM